MTSFMQGHTLYLSKPVVGTLGFCVQPATIWASSDSIENRQEIRERASKSR